MAFIYNPRSHYPIGEATYKYCSGVKTIESHNWITVITPEGVNIDVDYADILPATRVVNTHNEVNSPNDSLWESEHKSSLSFDGKNVPDLTDEGSRSNEEKFDSIATDCKKTNRFQFYQNQLNFAVWCATTGCGVGMKQH